MLPANQSSSASDAAMRPATLPPHPFRIFRAVPGVAVAAKPGCFAVKTQNLYRWSASAQDGIPNKKVKICCTHRHIEVFIYLNT